MNKNNYFEFVEHTNNDEFFMSKALMQAEIAWKKYNEVPIGAIIVKNNQIIATGFNICINSLDPTAHAEIIAIRNAAKILNNYRLINTTIYCTIEPCFMCFGALIQARIKRLAFGTRALKFNTLNNILNIPHDSYNHKFTITEGILGSECKLLIQNFFKQQRIKK